MARLEKEESRRRWNELRDLWCEFDPIGVVSLDIEWPRDEYDHYLAKTMRLLESGDEKGLEKYLKESCEERMGVSVPRRHYKAFIKRLQTWFSNKWNNSHV